MSPAPSRLVLRRTAGHPDLGAAHVGKDGYLDLRELTDLDRRFMPRVAVLDVVDRAPEADGGQVSMRRIRLRLGERFAFACGVSVEFNRLIDRSRAALMFEGPRDVEILRAEVAGRARAADEIRRLGRRRVVVRGAVA
jgi:hypothetical protein